METKPNDALEFLTPLPSKRRKMDVINDSAESMPANVGILNESHYNVSDLQLTLGNIREKYTEAIEKLMHKRNKLEIKELNKECKNMAVNCDRTLTIPDFKVPTKVESRCTEADLANLQELKMRIKRQMGVLETLHKMRSCPIAQAMLEL